MTRNHSSIRCFVSRFKTIQSQSDFSVWLARLRSKKQSQACSDYCISRHYPALESVATPYPALLETIIIRQAELLVQWQLVGFIHGVMNTNSTALSGETIDYGPRLRTSPTELSVEPERGA